MTDREHRFEPFLHLVDVGDDEALIAWGGFFFVRGTNGDDRWRIVDDSALDTVAEDGRTETIGARSPSYGAAVVEVARDGEVVARATADDVNHAWVRGLEPDTEYRYRVLVDERPWAEGERWDWDPDRETLAPSGRRYDNRFRTLPAGDARVPLTFAVLGDFGVGILRAGPDARRQLAVADALERAVDPHGVRLVLSLGDNVYLGDEDSVAGTGNEDDDWYASFYAPYRYLINRVPVFPAVGNHDAADTERSDDRQQLDDNFFLEHRFRPRVTAGRASLDPGLFYRFGFGALAEFVAIDTSLAGELDVEHYFDHPHHLGWVRDTLSGSDAPWIIPFCHHPPFCAGPHHGNTPGMAERLVPLFEAAGVRLVLSGHEHNFQHAVVDGVHYVVSGAGGKLNEGRPTGWEQAGTRAWADRGHFLLVRLDDERAEVHPVGGVDDDGTLRGIELVGPEGEPVASPLVVAAERR